ncbi:MAG: alpha-galactosidase [Treponema sp.]|jgi:alpha-galactosidase|nr:alpha-galactosidase [Treponema sp.]
MDIEIAGISSGRSPLPRGLSGGSLSYRAGREGLTGFTIPLDSWTFEALVELAGLGAAAGARFRESGDLALHAGGWSSWAPGWELAAGERLSGPVRLIPELMRHIAREGEGAEPGGDQDWHLGHFILYLRSGDHYLCMASREGGALPPVSYHVNRNRRLVTPEVFCPGKVWQAGELMAEIAVFSAEGYFNFKDALGLIYQQEGAFQSIGFLGKRPGGYESWYNHYTHIDEKIILEDLAGLQRTENLIKRWYIDREQPAVFQIDDGWEQAVGDWEADAGRFPRGLAPVAAQIEAAGLVPGLWLAPFLVTRRSRIFAERPGWLLRDESGEAVVAGYNNNWDKHRRFYCLDLSRKDVLEHIRLIINQVIDDWGFRYLKLDFLYAGFFSGVFAEGGSPWEHYERAAALLTGRKTGPSGLPLAYLGCGLPLGPSYRHFPLSRIGTDTREEWEWKALRLLRFSGRPGAYLSLKDTIGRSFMNGTVYLNDPDVVFLRSRNCKLTEHEKELLALTDFLLGGQLMCSDDPGRLSAADLALTSRITGLYERLAGDEYGATGIARDVFRLESRSGRIAGIINLGKAPYSLYPGREAALFRMMSAPGILVDHRLINRPEVISFAPHSISLAGGFYQR